MRRIAQLRQLLKTRWVYLGLVALLLASPGAGSQTVHVPTPNHWASVRATSPLALPPSPIVAELANWSRYASIASQRAAVVRQGDELAFNQFALGFNHVIVGVWQDGGEVIGQEVGALKGIGSLVSGVGLSFEEAGRSILRLREQGQEPGRIVQHVYYSRSSAGYVRRRYLGREDYDAILNARWETQMRKWDQAIAGAEHEQAASIAKNDPAGAQQMGIRVNQLRNARAERIKLEEELERTTKKILEGPATDVDRVAYSEMLVASSRCDVCNGTTDPHGCRVCQPSALPALLTREEGLVHPRLVQAAQRRDAIRKKMAAAKQ